MQKGKTLDRACLIIIVIITALCGYWAAKHLVSQQRLIRQEQELLIKGVKDLQLAETNLQQMKKILDNKRKELNDLNERIPESARIGEFLKQITSFMKLRNVNLVSMQPLPAVREKLYTKIPIHLIFNGPFANIYQLLYDLDHMNRLLVMEKIIINRSDLNQECHVDLVANVFER